MPRPPRPLTASTARLGSHRHTQFRGHPAEWRISPSPKTPSRKPLPPHSCSGPRQAFPTRRSLDRPGGPAQGHRPHSPGPAGTGDRRARRARLAFPGGGSNSRRIRRSRTMGSANLHLLPSRTRAGSAGRADASHAVQYLRDRGHRAGAARVTTDDGAAAAVRAKRKIRDAHIPYIVPDLADLPQRLDAVLTVIYLVFNEGYASTRGGPLARAHSGCRGNQARPPAAHSDGAAGARRNSRRCWL